MTARNLITLTRLDGHSFYLWFDDDSVETALKQLRKWAADPQLPQFTWYSAALLARRIRQQKGLRENDTR